MSARPTSILITGASSGIGKALALRYAEPGVHLALTGRDRDRLDEVSAQCRSRGADVTAAPLDVRDRDELAAWIRSVDDRHPIDLVIPSAGITTGLGLTRRFENPDAVRAILSTNLIGVLNTIDPVVERMRPRGRGQIALLGSIAGVRGLPYSPAYSATKAAVHAYAEALRGSLASCGLDVSLVIPGFVRTPLNAAHVAPLPLAMSDTRAAEIIRNGLDRRAAVIAFPRLLYYGANLLRVLPRRLVDFCLNLIHVDIPETRERANARRPEPVP